MIFAYACFAATIIALGIATYTDLKERIVPNKLVYAAIVAGALIKIIETLYTGKYEPILLAAGGGIIAFAFSYGLWRVGVWAGGDVKLVTAVAVINPVNYSAIAGAIGLNEIAGITTTGINIPIFGITLIIYSALSILPLGIMISLASAFKHREVFVKTGKALAGKALRLVALSLVISALDPVIAASGIEWIYANSYFITLLILIGLAISGNKIRLLLSAAVIIGGLATGATETIYGTISIAIPLLAGYAIWKLYSESKEYAFKETIKTSELEEGMIPDKYIVEKEGKIVFEESPSIKTVIKRLIDNKMNTGILEDFGIKGKIIASPKEAGGLEKATAEMLRKKAEKGLMPSKIKVKKTMAFVPAILLAYLILQITGDLIWQILL